MLYVALVASAVLLVAVNVAARRPSRPVLAVAGCGLAAALLSPLACMMMLPPVAAQAALLCVVGPLWRRSGRGTGRFLAASVGATLAAYALVGVSVNRSQVELARFRARFPYESLDDRLPPRPPRPGDVQPHDPDRLAHLEGAVRQEGMGFSGRARQLERLHERAVDHFVNSPGFGVARLVGTPSEAALTSGLRDAALVPQPSDPDPSTTPPPGAEVAGPDTSALMRLHADGVLDFVHPQGFGYVKGRQVAGFQPHGFARVPAAASARSARWEVGRVDLVGLLRHPTPVVYVSDTLPRMDALKGAPTRPLEPFEADGLEALRRGEELHVRGHRMVGAVRAAQQCLECHGGNRGDLLGAFSYTLRPVNLTGK